ncbi:cell division protein FtsA [Candidatus Kaiserbacteria bacterium CG10_big_fil_rev_8_21_14_0_10_49_17]|uniref:Cell division protein FtsA n=1 Tax=Candidatus Kaiserbacteria bacterium CG10_big_fil_rev_8_21_14_0_10_49_17 TaxID=1974609 RepID=A0A2M6WDM9_9BACT|nr:MAG: cell division protein FtsA [Candidatus Kaiserbacteria bacterium CG10_big_fil_rev_8_21_14_0_10_49_17]
MARNIITGIDIGTYTVKVVIAEHVRGKDKNFPQIIGTGMSESKGMRHGYIVGTQDVRKSIRAALSQAEKMAGVKVKAAYVAFGGVGLDEVHAKGEVIISRADLEVVDLDIKKALEDSVEKAAQKVINRKIIHEIPLGFRLDGTRVLGRPVGMHGSKLEADVLFITALEQHLQDLIHCVEDAGVEVIDVMASPIAAGLVSLTKAQKKAGCVLANIGSETVSIVVFEDSIPVSLKVFPIGSTDITNDIALGLKVSLDEAEQIKRGALTSTPVSKKKLDDIIDARLKDIFELVDKHLQSIGKNGLLPAGIIITGGGSGATSIEDLAKAALRLPSQIAATRTLGKTKIKDASWAVAYGLTIWGLTADEEPAGLQLTRSAGGKFLSLLKQFLP